MSQKTSPDKPRDSAAFAMAPNTKNKDGDVRRVGFELEYSGLGVKESAAMLKRVFGGAIERKNDYVYRVTDTPHGTFTAEVDFSLLADEKLDDYFADIGIDVSKYRRLKDSLENLIARLAKDVVPCEIVMPPLPMTDLSPALRVADALREERAEGTRASLLNAFGLHINTDLVTTEADYLLAHIRGSLLLFDWICVDSGVDLSRRALAFIQQYPAEYEKRILDMNYEPSRDELIDDYLELVGSRDYALDMMPAFAHLDCERVMDRAKASNLIKPRPAFHYRLLNSRVDEAMWRLPDEWRYWMRIEEVAADPQLLAELAGERQGHRRGRAWAERVAEILSE